MKFRQALPTTVRLSVDTRAELGQLTAKVKLVRRRATNVAADILVQAAVRIAARYMDELLREIVKIEQEIADAPDPLAECG